MVAAIAFSFTNANNYVYAAATIGNELSEPEIGWQRFDNTDSRLYYDSNEWKHQYELTSGLAYIDTWSVMTKQNHPLTIKFKGTKLRVIACTENSSTYKGSDNVRITNMSSDGSVLWFDAIDIDADDKSVTWKSSDKINYNNISDFIINTY